MKKDIGVQFLCKDCEYYNSCEYYHNRKRYSYICKNFHLPNKLDKIRAEMHATAEMHEDGDYYLRDEWIDEIIDKYKAESEVSE